MFIINAIQKWMDTIAGQTFMQYAYSWGAAIVILGTLFKLTHLPGANMMLFIGMGTEVFVFIVAGFERVTERVPENNAAVQSAAIVEQPVASVEQPTAAVEQPLAAVEQPSCNILSPDLFEATDPSSVEEAIRNYAEELKELTSVLTRVREQAARMGEDSEEMDNLNRTVTGISTVYELQLRSLSKQVSTIEQIDEQTRRMAENINELNNVYARMIQALTVNMQAAAPKA
ncbi:MAG: gliding motility protein GldL [Bacteroidaceae bacterium]|nr:gliding motility protein GldL [Bacteroidaceae bacterium]MBR6846370.1 gliding motility protein GldL [Bacteroidaceae bacterium]